MITYTSNNSCVCCGAVIPEGRRVCPNCEYLARPTDDPHGKKSADISKGRMIRAADTRAMAKDRRR